MTRLAQETRALQVQQERQMAEEKHRQEVARQRRQEQEAKLREEQRRQREEMERRQQEEDKMRKAEEERRKEQQKLEDEKKRKAEEVEAERKRLEEEKKSNTPASGVSTLDSSVLSIVIPYFLSFRIFSLVQHRSPIEACSSNSIPGGVEGGGGGGVVEVINDTHTHISSWYCYHGDAPQLCQEFVLCDDAVSCNSVAHMCMFALQVVGSYLSLLSLSYVLCFTRCVTLTLCLSNTWLFLIFAVAVSGGSLWFCRWFR